MPVQFKFDFQKAKEVLAFLASENVRGLDNYKICKLFFLADKCHLVKYGRPITGDEYFAMPYGPVPTNMLNIAKDFTSSQPRDPRSVELGETIGLDRTFQHPRFTARQEFTISALSKSDLETLKEIVARYGNKSFDELKVLTHEMIAYKKAWEKRGASASERMAFEDFFEEDEDAVAGAREEMIENSEMTDAFPEPANF